MTNRDNEHSNLPEPYDVLPGEEMKKKYGLYAENRPVIRLNPANLPAEFRSLIPLAESWGISDDLMREDTIERATSNALEELVKGIVEHGEENIYRWLGGPEASGPEFSAEYIAFTFLLQAADTARMVLDERRMGDQELD